jgi:hypothetical protein
MDGSDPTNGLPKNKSMPAGEMIMLAAKWSAKQYFIPITSLLHYYN